MKFKALFASSIFLLSVFLSPQSVDAQSTFTNSDIVAGINKERSARGLTPLTVDPMLTKAGQDRAQYLASVGQIFHVTAPVGTPWKELSQVGYTYTYAGENLALGYNTPTETVYRWMNSPTHRDNILGNNYTDIGVGVSMGMYQGRVAPYVVVYFAHKRREPVSTASLTPSTPVRPAVQPASEPIAVAPVIAKSTSASLTSSPSSSNSDQIRILTELISLLRSYLNVMKLSANL
jgi:uncharacterized protein YkwD